MSLDSVLNIIGLVVSLVGFIMTLFSIRKRYLIVLTAILLLIFISLVKFLIWHNYRQKVENLAERIVIVLEENTLIQSRIQIQQNFPNVQPSVLHDALNYAIDKGTVEERVIEIKDIRNFEYKFLGYRKHIE